VAPSRTSASKTSCSTGRRVATRFITRPVRETTVFEASERYREDDTPLIVMAGEELGTGSSRDWAAKGTDLLGIRATIGQSYERIYRDNLLGMGVLPLQFEDGDGWEELGLDGTRNVRYSGPRRRTRAQRRTHRRRGRRCGRDDRVRRDRTGQHARGGRSTSRTAACSTSCSAACSRNRETWGLQTLVKPIAANSITAVLFRGVIGVSTGTRESERLRITRCF